MRMRVPKDGVVGGTPTPRKDNVASVITAVATFTAANTKTGPKTFGRICRRMTVNFFSPINSAAITNSFPFSTSVRPRTVRAYGTQPESVIAKISTKYATDSWAAPGNADRKMPSTNKATKIAGKESITSHTRISTVSIQPPANPAVTPSPTPITMESATLTRLIESDKRSP